MVEGDNSFFQTLKNIIDVSSTLAILEGEIFVCKWHENAIKDLVC